MVRGPLDYMDAQDALLLGGARMIGTDQHGTVHMTFGMSDAEHAGKVSEFRENNYPRMPGVTYLEDHWGKDSS